MAGGCCDGGGHGCCVGVVRLLSCPFDVAWCLVCELCLLAVVCVYFRCSLSFVFLGDAECLELVTRTGVTLYLCVQVLGGHPPVDRGCVRPRPCVCIDLIRLGVWPYVELFCLLRMCVLEYGLVSLGLRCFLRLARALYCCSTRCLAYVAFSMLHGEISKRLATPRNTEDKKHIQSTQSAQPTNLTDQAPSTTERTARETHNTN